MRSACFMLAMVIGATGTVEARMYQWTNPVSGVTQLSGTPPAWYRSARGGPRVFVFEDGQMVDDSAVTVPEYQRIELRALAFGVEAAAISGAALPDPVSAATPDSAPDSARDIAADAAPVGDTDATAATPETAEQTVDRLKRVLQAWDRQRAADARAIVDQAPLPGPSPQQAPGQDAGRSSGQPSGLPSGQPPP